MQLFLLLVAMTTCYYALHQFSERNVDVAQSRRCYLLRGGRIRLPPWNPGTGHKLWVVGPHHFPGGGRCTSPKVWRP